MATYSMSVFVSNLSGLYLFISGVQRARWPRKADWINVRVTPSSCPSTVLVFVASTACKGGNKEQKKSKYSSEELEYTVSRNDGCVRLCDLVCACVWMKPCSADLPADA